MRRLSVAALLCAVLLAGCSQGAGPQSGDLTLDTRDSEAMHAYGMPTKADVMHWHHFGQWGWYEVSDGADRIVMHDSLPGGPDAWDSLYGIPDNPRFEYR